LACRRKGVGWSIDTISMHFERCLRVPGHDADSLLYAKAPAR
jgi:hypothetical protein